MIDPLVELRRVILLERATLGHLADALDASFDKAVRCLAACQGRVVVTGVGKSGLVAQKIAATLVSTGTPAVFLHAGEGMHGDVGIVTKEDVVLAVGKSGESEELLAILPFVRHQGARIISITAVADSRMARLSDITLVTPIQEEACPFQLAPTSSSTAAMVLGDAIAMTLMAMSGFQPQDFALYHPGGQLGKRLLLTVGQLMRSGEANSVVSVSGDVRSMLLEMTSKRAGAVSIVDEHRQLLGLVTDYDIRRVLERGEDIFALSVRDIMNEKPSAIYEDEKAYAALERMEQRDKPISVLPVLNRNDHVVGMIHLHDLLAKGL